MNTDLTFITNEPSARRSLGAGGDASLLNRFKVLIKDARFFDSWEIKENYDEPIDSQSWLWSKIMDGSG